MIKCMALGILAWFGNPAHLLDLNPERDFDLT
jgi:hypothetical protein